MAPPIVNHVYPKLFELYFSFPEFVSASKKSVYSIRLFLKSPVATPIF